MHQGKEDATTVFQALSSISWLRAKDTRFGLETRFCFFLYKHTQRCTEVWQLDDNRVYKS